MKKFSVGGLLLLVAMLASATPSHAQSADALKVNVPFNFVAGGVKFPAGSYIVDRASTSSSDLLRLRAEDGESAAFIVSTATSSSDDSTKLVFNRYAERYFLSEIHTLSNVYQLPRPRLGRMGMAADQESVSLPAGN